MTMGWGNSNFGHIVIYTKAEKWQKNSLITYTSRNANTLICFYLSFTTPIQALLVEVIFGNNIF